MAKKKYTENVQAARKRKAQPVHGLEEFAENAQKRVGCFVSFGILKAIYICNSLGA